MTARQTNKETKKRIFSQRVAGIKISPFCFPNTQDSVSRNWKGDTQTMKKAASRRTFSWSPADANGFPGGGPGGTGDAARNEQIKPRARRRKRLSGRVSRGGTEGAAQNERIKTRARRRKRLSGRGSRGTGGAARNERITPRPQAQAAFWEGVQGEPSFSRKKVPPGVTSPSFQ